jgi:hypothetical protein
VIKSVLVTLLFLSFIPVSQAAESCQLVRLASVDMNLNAGGTIDVPMTAGGQPLALEVSTGIVFSMISESTVARLGLKPLAGATFIGFGGQRIDHYAYVHDVNFGGLRAAKIPMSVVPDSMLPDRIGGVLGPDVMRNYDVEFDFANAKFNLFSRDHCEGQVVYWTKEPFAVIPMQLDDAGHIVVPVRLDGNEVRAAVNTSSARSRISLETVKSLFDLKEDDPRLKPSANSDGTDNTYPFKILSMEGVRVDNPDLHLVPNEVSKLPGFPKLVLGLNVLRHLHLYIAYKERKLYVTPASAH